MDTSNQPQSNKRLSIALSMVVGVLLLAATFDHRSDSPRATLAETHTRGDMRAEIDSADLAWRQRAHPTPRSQDRSQDQQQSIRSGTSAFVVRAAQSQVDLIRAAEALASRLPTLRDWADWDVSERQEFVLGQTSDYYHELLSTGSDRALCVAGHGGHRSGNLRRVSAAMQQYAPRQPGQSAGHFVRAVYDVMCDAQAMRS